MSRYDGLIIPRSYSEYINKTDAATLLQALQLSGVMDDTPTAGSSKPVKSSGLVGLSAVDVVETGNMHPVTSNAVAETAADLEPVDEVALNNMHSVTSNAVALAIKNHIKSVAVSATTDSGGNTYLGYDYAHMIPIAFVPINYGTELVYWQFSQYGNNVYLRCSRTNSTIEGTLYYIEY